MRAFLIALMLASPAAAQVEQDILEDLMRDFGETQAPERGPITSVLTDGAVLRGLDTLNGEVEILTIPAGGQLTWQRLDIALEACRKPAEGDQPDAYAFLEIRDTREDLPRFAGWMIGSSPAFNALDHPRYDVWVEECYTGQPPERTARSTLGVEEVLAPAPQDRDAVLEAAE